MIRALTIVRVPTTQQRRESSPKSSSRKLTFEDTATDDGDDEAARRQNKKERRERKTALARRLAHVVTEELREVLISQGMRALDMYAECQSCMGFCIKVRT